MSSEPLPDAVAELRVSRVEMQRAVEFAVGSIKRSERMMSLSFDGQNLRVSRGMSSSLVAATGTWDGVASCGVRDLQLRMANLSERIDPIVIRVVDEQLRIGEFVVSCTWKTQKKR